MLSLSTYISQYTQPSSMISKDIGRLGWWQNLIASATLIIINLLMSRRHEKLILKHEHFRVSLPLGPLVNMSPNMYLLLGLNLSKVLYQSMNIILVLSITVSDGHCTEVENSELGQAVA